jgi:hypothetical protein
MSFSSNVCFTGKFKVNQSLDNPQVSRRLRLSDFRTVGTWGWHRHPLPTTKYFWHSLLNSKIIINSGNAKTISQFCPMMLSSTAENWISGLRGWGGGGEGVASHLLHSNPIIQRTDSWLECWKDISHVHLALSGSTSAVLTLKTDKFVL